MRAAGAGFLLTIGFILGVACTALAQATDQQTTVLHLSQTAERSVLRDVSADRAPGRGDRAPIRWPSNRRSIAAWRRHSTAAHQVQGVRVETGAYGVGEERPQSGPSRWRGTQSLIVTSKAADAALKLAGALQSDGLLMSSIGYEVSPETLRGAEEDLTAEGLAALDRRAGSIAGRMHLGPAALSRSARRQRRDRWTPGAAFCRHGGDGRTGGRARRGDDPGDDRGRAATGGAASVGEIPADAPGPAAARHLRSPPGSAAATSRSSRLRSPAGAGGSACARRICHPKSGERCSAPW